MPKPLASVSARFVDTSMIVPLDSMKVVPLCGAATSVMECTQLLLPPVNSGLGVGAGGLGRRDFLGAAVGHQLEELARGRAAEAVADEVDGALRAPAGRRAADHR